MFEEKSFRLSQANLRRMLLLKYTFIVFVATFITLQLLVVDSLDGWPEDTDRDVAKYILPNENTTIILPKILNSFSDNKIDVLLIVSSDPRRPDRREAIRRTWGRDQSTSLKTGLIFLTGISRNASVNNLVSEEAITHGDILMERFHESYLNLTVKSLMLVKFAATYNINAEFIFKVNFVLLPFNLKWRDHQTDH